MRRATRPRPVRLRLEPLEERSLLSASFSDLNISTSNFDAHRVIVALRSDTNFAQLSALSPNVVALGDSMYRVELGASASVQSAVSWYQQQPWVRFVQPDYSVSVGRTSVDPSFTSQWALSNTGQNGGTPGADIHAPAAWNVTTGTGRTIVAVIDTGVDLTNPDLAANIWTNPAEKLNGKDDDHDGYVDDIHGWNFVDNNNNVMDDNGHGTHVAGIIGAVGDNGVGVAGVDWHVQIMPLKFLDATGRGYLSNAIRALNFAVAHGATVSNNSYTGGGYVPAFNDAIAAAAHVGHIFVAAAGNDGANTDSSPAYPADYNLDNVIAVAATDRNDRLASFSNYGAHTVDLGAPGVSIYSTYRGGSYATMSGTSMAAPFVTGAVALLHDLHPTWGYRQIISQILNTTDPLPALQGKTFSGGRLDLARALGAGSVDTTGLTITAATFSGSGNGFTKLRVTFSKAIDLASFSAGDITSFSRNGQAIGGVTYSITPVSGTTNQFDVSFTPQTATGTYALTIGPDIRDTSGNRMSNPYTATASISAGTLTTLTMYSPDPPKLIGDLSRITSTLTINQDVTVSQLSVKLSVSHPNDGDLRITLQGPDGTKVVLFDRRGGSGQDISTVLDDRAKTPIGQDAAPFLGWHKPEQALSALAGKSARGTWTLIVEDLAAGNSGKLNSWALIVEGAASSTSANAARDVNPMLAVEWAESSRPTVQAGDGGPRSKTRSTRPADADDARQPLLGASLPRTG